MSSTSSLLILLWTIVLSKPRLCFVKNITEPIISKLRTNTIICSLHYWEIWERQSPAAPRCSWVSCPLKLHKGHLIQNKTQNCRSKRLQLTFKEGRILKDQCKKTEFDSQSKSLSNWIFYYKYFNIMGSNYVFLFSIINDFIKTSCTSSYNMYFRNLTDDTRMLYSWSPYIVNVNIFMVSGLFLGWKSFSIWFFSMRKYVFS